jgi:hypothetical protein
LDGVDTGPVLPPAAATTVSTPRACAYCHTVSLSQVDHGGNARASRADGRGGGVPVSVAARARVEVPQKISGRQG